MNVLKLIVQLLIAVLAAIGRGVVTRLLRGPAAAGWSWTVELRAVALRGFIMGAAAHPDPRARAKLEERFDPPLRGHLRRVIRVRADTVDGVRGDWLERTNPALIDSCTLLYFHGGGYVAGSPATHREWVSRLTWALGCRAFVPDYRLAPTHRFPAALDDAIAVYLGLLEGGIDPSTVVVAGDSAGGGLAAALLLRLRDEGRPLPAGALLFSPYTDLEHTGGSIVANAATDYLPLGEIRPNIEYLGDHDPRDPYASPLYGEYHDVPRLLVFAGELEMIRDDSTRLVDRVRASGGTADLYVAPSMYHVWPALLPRHPETLAAEAKSREFVTAVVPGPR